MKRLYKIYKIEFFFNVKFALCFFLFLIALVTKSEPTKNLAYKMKNLLIENRMLKYHLVDLEERKEEIENRKKLFEKLMKNE